MKSFYARVLGVLLMALVIISSTGISFYSHECRSENESQIRVFPEILGTGSSCCGYQLAAGQCAAHNDLSGSFFKEPDCCLTSFKYFKLSSFYQLRENINFKPLYLPFLVILIPASLPVEVLVTSNFDYYLDLAESPPLFGKKLLYFIHSVKIPDPAC